MIYTCTLHPSLDYYLEYEKPLKVGKINRSHLEYYEAGGKGINVSIVLSNMQLPSRALGFLGGFTKDFYISLLQKHSYIQPYFTYIEGHTRINVKVLDGTHTNLNTAGPYITDKSMDQLVAKVDRLDHNDFLVFSGNSPVYLLDKVDKMIKNCHENGVKIVLDTNPDITSRCLKYQPFLINPSIQELSEMFQCSLNSFDEILDKAQLCVELGAKNVMVSIDDSSSILATEDGVYRANKMGGKVVEVNSVGSNDAMVAGFVMNSLRTNKNIESFKYANCCGLATVYSKSLAIREKIEEYVEQVEIEKIR